MRLPSLKNLKVEDFNSQKSWIGKLLSPLNQFMIQVYTALNGNLEFGVNVKGQVKTLTIDTDTVSYPVRFQTTFNTKPQGLWIINVRDLSGNPTTLTNAVFVDWTWKNNEIQINSFIGLPASTKFEITLIII